MATRRKKTDVTAALAAVKESDVKKVLDEIGTTQASVQGTLAALGVTLSSKIEELNNLETAIDSRKDELREIHDIEVNADTLDQIEQQVAEAELAATDKARTRQKAWTDENTARTTLWTRESEEHEYAMQQLRTHDEAEAKTDSEKRQRLELFRTEDVNKQLNARIEEVDEREAAVKELEATVEGIPDAIGKAVSEAKADVTKQLTAGFGHEKAILKKDAESAVALATAQQTALNTQIENLQAQLATVQEQLETAHSDARQIATSAVEASSQRQALDTLQKSIETQAQGTGGKGGR